MISSGKSLLPYINSCVNTSFEGLVSPNGRTNARTPARRSRRWVSKDGQSNKKCFYNGLNNPIVSSVIFSPVSATLLKILAISWCISGGAYLMSSACISSGPALFPFFSEPAAFAISASVDGFFILCGACSLMFPS